MKNLLITIGKNAKRAFSISVSSKKKDQVLEDYQKLILRNQLKIINQNKKDLYFATKKKLKTNLVKRLILDKKKISSIIKSIKSIKNFKDPVNKTLQKWKK